jgi:hypothetical protein
MIPDTQNQGYSLFWVILGQKSELGQTIRDRIHRSASYELEDSLESVGMIPDTQNQGYSLFWVILGQKSELGQTIRDKIHR